MKSAVFSPNGKYILTRSGERTVHLWSVATGKVVRQFSRQAVNPDFQVQGLTFSHDGNSIAASIWGDTTDNGVVIWSALDGKLRKWLPQSHDVSTIAFSNNDQAILIGGVGSTGPIGSADIVRNEKCATANAKHGRGAGCLSPPLALGYAKNGCSASDDKHYTSDVVSLWSLATSKLQWQHKLPVSIEAAAFSSDGKVILVGCSGIRQEDEDKYEKSIDSDPHPDMRLALPIFGEAQLLDAITGKTIKKFGSPRTDVSSIALSRDGRYVLTGTWGEAILWNAKTGQKVRQFDISRDTERLASLSFSKDNRHFLVDAGFGANIWDIQTGEPTQKFITRVGFPMELGWGTTDQSLHVISSGYFASLQDGMGIKVKHTLQINPNRFRFSSVFSSDGQQFLVGDDKGKIHYFGTLLKETSVFSGHTGRINSIEFSSDGNYGLSGGEDDTVFLWDLEHLREVRHFKVAAAPQNSDSPLEGIQRAVFSADGNSIVTRTMQGVVQMWEVESGKKIWQEQDGFGGQVNSMLTSRDGRYLLVATWNSAYVLDAKTGHQLWFTGGETHSNWDQILAADFSPDGKYILTGDYNGSAHLLESRTGEKVRDLPVSFESLFNVKFSPSGKFVLAQSSDKAVHLLSLEGGKELCSFFTMIDGTWAVVSPDGRYSA